MYIIFKELSNPFSYLIKSWKTKTEAIQLRDNKCCIILDITQI